MSLSFLSTPNLLFQWYPQSKELKKNKISVWNAEIQHLTTHGVWNTGKSIGCAQEKNERQDETQFSTKIDGFFEFQPLTLLNANVLLFCRSFFESHSPCVWPNWGFWCAVCFPYFTDNSNIIAQFAVAGERKKGVAMLVHLQKRKKECR